MYPSEDHPLLDVRPSQGLVERRSSSSRMRVGVAVCTHVANKIRFQLHVPVVYLISMCETKAIIDAGLRLCGSPFSEQLELD